MSGVVRGDDVRHEVRREVRVRVSLLAEAVVSVSVSQEAALWPSTAQLTLPHVQALARADHPMTALHRLLHSDCVRGDAEAESAVLTALLEFARSANGLFDGDQPRAEAELGFLVGSGVEP